MLVGCEAFRQLLSCAEPQNGERVTDRRPQRLPARAVHLTEHDHRLALVVAHLDFHLRVHQQGAFEQSRELFESFGYDTSSSMSLSELLG